MIEFDCPKCGEPMEISSRKAGETVRCVGCGERVEVPDRPARRPARRSAAVQDDGLTGGEWAMYTVVFLLIPCANVLISSILYYVWRAERPRRANQINLLGFAVFGFHVLLSIAQAVLVNR